MFKVTERFLRYIKCDTKSDEDSSTVPSTPGQLEFAGKLAEELKDLGLKDVSLDEKGYIMATLPSNIEEEVPVVGFIAHMDTSDEISGVCINPRLVENYNGCDILLNKDKDINLSPIEFPELKDCLGETLITTDGTTLLGADDKAGIAEIVTAMEFLTGNPQIRHGNIRIGFTPDEEVGRGADHFDVHKFGADFAYTVDGGEMGELEYENFNAARAKLIFRGKSVHPGSAKGKMVNSMLMAAEFINLMPFSETPAETEGYEGFYHITSMKGSVEETRLKYIIRDFDEETFKRRKGFILGLVESMNKKYGKDTVTVDIEEEYSNMKEKIEPVMFVVDIALQAMKEAGIEPKVRPIRGGTDGSRLSFKGLPTPNIFTGGYNFHGKYEYITVSSMEKAVEVIIKIAEKTACLPKTAKAGRGC